MPTSKPSKTLVEQIKSLKLFSELELPDGRVITRFPDGEFKLSPHGAKGDYDTGCRFVWTSELAEEFGQ